MCFRSTNHSWATGIEVGYLVVYNKHNILLKIPSFGESNRSLMAKFLYFLFPDSKIEPTKYMYLWLACF